MSIPAAPAFCLSPPRFDQSSRFIDSLQHVLMLHLTSPWLFLFVRDYRVASGSNGRDRTPLTFLRLSQVGIFLRFGCPRVVFRSFLRNSISAHERRHCRFSSRLGAPLSPYSGDAAGIPGHIRKRPFKVRCVLTVASGGFSVICPFVPLSSFPVLKVLSSTLLPGFTGLASSVLHVNLPPSVPSRFGFSSIGSVF